MLHMFAMEYAGQLRAKKQNEAGNVSPRQHRDHRADRAVDLIVVKVIQAPREGILRAFPKEAADNCARNRVTQRHSRVRHESIDDRKEGKGDQQTYQGKD